MDAYSKNDISAAPELELRSGDLVLRDRGYPSVGEIHRHQQAGAHFIYRHKTGTLYRDVQRNEPLDLAQLLRRHGRLDREVALKDAARTHVRLGRRARASRDGRPAADEGKKRRREDTTPPKPCSNSWAGRSF